MVAVDATGVCVLKGERVILRPMRREYFGKLSDYANDVELSLLASAEPPLPTEVERLQARFEQAVVRPPSELAWFGIEVQGGILIGDCALRNFDDTARTCELRVAIGDRDYFGRGYGRDVTRMLVKYAFRLRNMRKVWLTVPASNERALRSFAGAGFVEEGRLRQHIWLDGRYDDVVAMATYRDPLPPGAAPPEAPEVHVEGDHAEDAA